MIEVRDLQVRYGTRVVARVPELDVGAGECVAHRGGERVGQVDHAARRCSGLTEGADVSGHVRVVRRRGAHGAPRRLREIRGARVALVMQTPQAALSPTTRLGTLMRRALSAGTARAARTARERARWRRPSRRCMLDPEILRRYPHEISGGQAQRFAIALAIALGAEVMLADEPTSALDVTVQAEVVGVLRRLREERGLALLLVSHDLALVSTIADRVLVMRDGAVVESGPAAEVLAGPSHPYTRELLEALPDDDLLRAERGDARRTGATAVVHDVTLDLTEGGVGLIGESGSGKTTLARAFLGLLHPHVRKYLVRRSKTLKKADMREFRGDVQPVFQARGPRPQDARRRLRSPRRCRAGRPRHRVPDLLDQVGLDPATWPPAARTSSPAASASGW